MPGIRSKTTPIIPRNRPYPADGRDAAAAIRAMRIPGGEQIARGFEVLTDSVTTLHKAARENPPEINDLLVTDGITGRVLAAIGQYEKEGIVTSGGYFSELHAGDPYGNGDPAYAILNVTTDGKVQVGQNGWIDVLDPYGADAAWIGTQFDTLPVTGAVNNGSGLIRLTVVGHTLATGDQPAVYDVGGLSDATGVFTVTKIDANHIDLQASVFVGTYTSGGTVSRVLHISGAANNGAGLIRLTSSVAHTYESGDKVNVATVGGVPNATGQWIITVIDATHFDLVGSTFAGAYTSGGVCLRYFAGMMAQTFAIGNSFADYKLRAFADGTLRIRGAVIELDGSGATIILDPTTGTISVTQVGGAGYRTQISDGYIILDDILTLDDETILQPGFYQSFRENLAAIASSKMLDIYGYTGATEFGPLLSLTQFRGTVATPTATQSADTLGGLIAWGYDGTGESEYAAGVRAVATENHGIAAHGTKLIFEITPNGGTSTATPMTLDQDGKLNVAAVYKVAGTQVIGTRKTGWSAPTGSATRTSFATGSVTLSVLAEHVKALIDDLTLHGAIGA